LELAGHVYDFTDPVNLHKGERRDWSATGL
jgi:hypothetical protein